jgi:hypothetical protein
MISRVYPMESALDVGIVDAVVKVHWELALCADSGTAHGAIGR